MPAMFPAATDKFRPDPDQRISAQSEISGNVRPGPDGDRQLTVKFAVPVPLAPPSVTTEAVRW